MKKVKKSLDRLKLYFSMVRYGNAHNADFAREHWRFFREMEDRLAPYFDGLSDVRALDVGCGKAAWLTLLFHSIGARATGVDTEVVKSGMSPAKYLGILLKNGPERAARTLYWEMVYAKPYYRELDAQTPFPLNFEGLDTRAMSVTDMDFEDNTFDIMASYEVLEHFPDMDAAAREMARVLKPGGLTFHYVHNYTSLSGGHHIAWKYPDAEPSVQVPPWDHLRKNKFPEIPSWVNGMREKEYREIFSKYFEIEDWQPGEIEGRALLTPEIREELKEYSEEELLTKGFIIVARPKE